MITNWKLRQKTNALIKKVMVSVNQKLNIVRIKISNIIFFLSVVAR